MPTHSAGIPPDAAGDPGAIARRGMLWFAAGATVIIVTYLLLSWGESPWARFGPLVPMCVGAYGLVLGLEKMVTGLRASGPHRGRLAIPCAALVTVAIAAGCGAWFLRAPYWKAIERRNGGERASEILRTIAERHAATMQSGAAGQTALESWKRTAEAGVGLKSDFTSALDGARYLEKAASGTLRAQSEIDVRFYALCLEWMDLYQSVLRSFGDVSMTEPPDEWDRRQNDIIDRIQALPRHPQEGS
jgi:hypothetical protein